MSTTELVAKLRSTKSESKRKLLDEAADTIERLEAERNELAIAALREQEERSKGCEYCDGKQKLLPVEDDDYSSGNSICFYANGKPYLFDADGCDIWIKFCPMCGRKLEVDG